MASKRCGIDDVAGLGESRDRPWGIVAVAFPLRRPAAKCIQDFCVAAHSAELAKGDSAIGQFQNGGRATPNLATDWTLSDLGTTFFPNRQRPSAATNRGSGHRLSNVAALRTCLNTRLSFRHNLKCSGVLASKEPFSPTARSTLRGPAGYADLRPSDPIEPPFGNEPRPRPAAPIYCR